MYLHIQKELLAEFASHLLKVPRYPTLSNHSQTVPYVQFGNQAQNRLSLFVRLILDYAYSQQFKIATMHQVARIEVRRIFTPAPAPDDSHADVPADTTPAGPPGAPSPSNEREHSVSAKTVEENGEHDTTMQTPKPLPLHQKPLKPSSESTLCTRNSEWELSQEWLAAQSVRLRAPPRSSCDPFVPNQDDLFISPILVEDMNDGNDTALAGSSLAVDTVHAPCNGGSACDDLPPYRLSERRSMSSSRATVQVNVHAPAPVAPLQEVVDNRQDHRISFEDMEAATEHRHEDSGVASEIAETPVLRSPYDSGRSHRGPQRSPRWDQNIKQNRCYRWLWLVLPDLCVLFSLFLAAIFMEKYLDNFRWMTRTFPMTWDPRTGNWVGPVDISWPKEGFIVPVLTAEILIPLIPTVIILAMQIWVRNFWDFNAAIFGLFKGIAIVYVASHPILKSIENCRKILFESEPPLYLGFIAKMHFRTLLQVIFKSFIGNPSLKSPR